MISNGLRLDSPKDICLLVDKTAKTYTVSLVASTGKKTFKLIRHLETLRKKKGQFLSSLTFILVAVTQDPYLCSHTKSEAS